MMSDAADGESGGSLVPVEPVGGNAFCYFLLPGHQASHKLLIPLSSVVDGTNLTLMFTNDTLRVLPTCIIIHCNKYNFRKSNFKLLLIVFHLNRPNLFYSDNLIMKILKGVK